MLSRIKILIDFYKKILYNIYRKLKKEKVMEDKFYWDSFACEIQCDEFENPEEDFLSKEDEFGPIY